jgi:hypothetical protein
VLVAVRLPLHRADEGLATLRAAVEPALAGEHAPEQVLLAGAEHAHIGSNLRVPLIRADR